MDARPSKAMLNLGCGRRYHPEWVNVDIAPAGPEVMRWDLRRALPFRNGAFAAVYHSNILEHFRRPDASTFMKECFRMLKPGGILRVATPDLERICRLYLEKLQAVKSGEAAQVSDYDWMMIEMYDQTVREKSGGGMLAFLSQNPLPNERFVFERVGQEGRELMTALRKTKQSRPRTRTQEMIRRPRILFEVLGRGFLKLFFGADAPCALDIGRFRLAGEVHQWMYDRFSLGRLMSDAGFRNPTACSATESGIPNWGIYHLDALSNGDVIKPDSFYMEATKPA